MYGTFNRVIRLGIQTVRLIETVLIIESLEYVIANFQRDKIGKIILNQFTKEKSLVNAVCVV